LFQQDVFTSTNTLNLNVASILNYLSPYVAGNVIAITFHIIPCQWSIFALIIQQSGSDNVHRR